MSVERRKRAGREAESLKRKEKKSTSKHERTKKKGTGGMTTHRTSGQLAQSILVHKALDPEER